MAEPKSILNTFVESINWSMPMDQLKALILEHIGRYCKNPLHTKKMNLVVTGLDTVESLQRYTFNALLKFEGQGVVELIPR